MNERPTWADERPWEKYPADVTADVEIRGAGWDLKLSGVAPAAAHSALCDAYVTTDSESLRKAISQVAKGGGFMGYSGEGVSVTLNYHRPVVDTGETLRCPRRDETFGADERFPGPDKWQRVGDWRCCSYCGSMHPDDVIEAVKRFGLSIVAGTDKGYKRYIHIPNTPNASFGPIKFYVMHFDEQQRATFNALLTRPPESAKEG